MKKYIIFLLISLCLGGISRAQLSLERQLIGTTGNASSQGSVTLSASVGEPMVRDLTSGSISLSQGFQQADEVAVGVDEPLIELTYQVFPNPTQGKVRVDITVDKPMEIGIEIFDIHGRSCGIRSAPQWIQKQASFDMDLTPLSSATYLLVLMQDGNNIKAIRIEKSN